MKVLCKLPNAAEIISGVKFSPVKDEDGKVIAMESEDVSDDQAAAFASIPGYELVEDGRKAPAKPASKGGKKAVEPQKEPEPVVVTDPDPQSDDESVF